MKPDTLPLEAANETTLAPVGAVSMFERLALDPNVPVDKLERLIAMQERIMEVNAKAAFNRAFADLQADLPTVIEHGKTDKGTYAQLEDIIEAVRPILRKHGFSLSHTTEWPDKATVKVIGLLTHTDGYERRSEFMASADTSGSKNAIQALGSSVAYGRRYTTKDLLNIVTRGEDDDGARSTKASKPAEPAGYDEWLINMEAVADEGEVPLRQAWEKSKPLYRNYITKHDGHLWMALKAKALKVTS
jgi:hypothetical protein